MKKTPWLKYLILLGLFILPFIPLFVSTSLFFPFITGKNFAFRIIVEIVFGLWAILALFDREYRPKMSWIFYTIMALTGVATLATIFGVNPYQSFWSNYERMDGLVTLLHLAALFTVLISVFKTESTWRKYFYTSLGANALVLIYGIWQLLGKAQIHQGGVRLDASLGNAAYLATYCLFHIFIATYFFTKSRDAWPKWLLGLSILANLFILYFTATRGAILGLIGGIVLASVLLTVRYWHHPRVKKVALSFLVGAVVLVGLFWVFRNSSFIQNSPVLSRFASISLTEATTQSRFLVWKMAWQGFRERPILGWGPGNFSYVFSKYYDPLMWRQEPWFDRAHNLIFDWLVSAGLVGLLAYFSALAATAYYLLRKFFNCPSEVLSAPNKRNQKTNLETETTTNSIGAAIILGLLGAYVFQNLFVFDNVISYWLYFSVIAFAHSVYATSANNGESQPNSKKVGIGQNKTLAYAQVGTIVIFVGLISSLYYINVKPIIASQNLIEAIRSHNEGEGENLKYYEKVFAAETFGSGEAREQLLTTTISVLSKESASMDLKNGFSKLALDEWGKQFYRFEDDARSHLYYGVFLSNVGMFDEAQKHLLRAKELSPKKQMIMFELATLYNRMEKFDLALAQLKEAFELEPGYSEARKMYALEAILVGDRELSADLVEPIKESQDYFLDDRFLQFNLQVDNQTALKDILGKRVTFYEQRIEEEPKVGENYLNLARAQASLGDLISAKENIKKAVEVDSGLTKEAMDLAQALGIQ